jgi:mono/diheme cytochrome c family protein
MTAPGTSTLAMAAFVVAAAGLWSGGSFAQTAAAPFTQDQVDAGRDDYMTNCSSCHGKELSSATAPALTGKYFNASWSKHTIADLFTFIQNKMPYNQGGTLSDDAYANIVAFILSKNGAKAGSEALTATTSAKIGEIVSGGSAK